MSRLRIFSTTQHPALSHTCPTCGAVAGQTCFVWFTAKRAKEIHVARVRLVRLGELTK